jgi:hypothetical protein
MKKSMYLINLVMILALVLSISGCETLGEMGLPTSVSPVAYSYSGNLPIYPAVYYTLKNDTGNNWQYAYFDKVNIFADEYVIERAFTRDGSTPTFFTVSLSEKDGSLLAQYSDIEQNGKTFSRFLLFNSQIITNKFIENANSILNNPTAYEEAKVAAQGDWTFLRAMIKQMNDVQKQMFAEQEYLNQVRSFTGNFSDVEFVGDNDEYAGQYKYIVKISMEYTKPGYPTVALPGDSTLLLQDQRSWDFLRFYTNDDSYVSASKDDEITVTGSVVRFENTMPLDSLSVKILDESE